MSERDFIEEQAVDFQNRHYFGYDAAVHLEDADDEAFWNTLLQKIKPGKYDFIYYSRSKSGNETRGCEQCLQYKDYLNSRFFICIDSDLRYLLGPDAMSAVNFIAQTYTYSWESHYCFAERIQDRLKEKCSDAAEMFDYREFLRSYSRAVYPALLFLLHLKKNAVSDGFEGRFNAFLPKQVSIEQMKNNGRSFVDDLCENMKELCINHPLWKDFDVVAARNSIQDSNLTEDNAYLYVRGHNVFDLVAYIGRSLCRRFRIPFRDEVLLGDLSKGCDELKRVYADLGFILDQAVSTEGEQGR